MSDEMNEMRQMIADTADRIFRDLCEPDVVNAAEKGTWPADLWNTIEESGMTHIAIAEENGGGGGTIGMAMAVLRAAGAYSAPLPLAETMLGGVALASAGQAIPAGPLGFALPAEDESVSLSQSGDNYVLMAWWLLLPGLFRGASLSWLPIWAASRLQPSWMPTRPTLKPVPIWRVSRATMSHSVMLLFRPVARLAMM